MTLTFSTDCRLLQPLICQRNNHTTFDFLITLQTIYQWKPAQLCLQVLWYYFFYPESLVHHCFLRSLFPTCYETKPQCQTNMTVVRYSSVYHYYDHLKSYINNFTQLKQRWQKGSEVTHWQWFCILKGNVLYVIATVCYFVFCRRK